jgi:site-specific recombinase XerC
MKRADIEAVQSFHRYLVSERACSAHTVRAYTREVERLAGSAEAERAGGLDRLDPLGV